VESASPTPWKYGGVYLDTDVVVMQELYNLKNAVGLYKLNPVYP
jgi:mannosyltransferase OCH1-like enzyme